ncbi:MAG: hypothetical protein WBC65_06800 [Ignavibacteria bacterium]
MNNPQNRNPADLSASRDDEKFDSREAATYISAVCNPANLSSVGEVDNSIAA